jgi:GNAT superfamily N-acetyltransferase
MATIDDAGAVADILRESFAEYESHYTRDAYIATTPLKTIVVERLSEGPIWIACAEGACVGTISTKLTPDGVYVRGMAIVPGARGQGLGDALVRAVEEFAREHDARRIYLSTTPFLHCAIRFYERYGFTRCEGGPSELHGTPVFSMELKLLSPRAE